MTHFFALNRKRFFQIPSTLRRSVKALQHNSSTVLLASASFYVMDLYGYWEMFSWVATTLLSTLANPGLALLNQRKLLACVLLVCVCVWIDSSVLMDHNLLHGLMFYIVTQIVYLLVMLTTRFCNNVTTSSLIWN